MGESERDGFSFVVVRVAPIYQILYTRYLLGGSVDTRIHRRFLAHIGDAITNFAFPPWCLGCSEPGSWFCSNCRASVELLLLGWCGRCGRRARAVTTLCQRCATELGLSAFISAYPYRGAVERVIRTMKYRPAQIGLSVLVAREPHDRLAAVVALASVVIPVPLHRDRERRRGFNQAEVLAKLLLTSVDQSRMQRHLIRLRERPAQVGLDRRQRQANLAAALTWRGPPLTGQTVCLVDDVITTGATIAEAARAVRAAGARWVLAVTLAQTPPDRK